MNGDDRWQDLDELPYTPPDDDRLGVLSSTLRVVVEGENVWINLPQLDKLGEKWANESWDKPRLEASAINAHYHFNDGTERTLNWLLVLDTLNFCFWGEAGQPRWKISYKDKTLDGYWAEATALTRAVEEGFPLWDAEFIANISSADLATIFRGEQVIPLFEKRLQVLHEAGEVLQKDFEGQFVNALQQAEGSAVSLAQLLAQHFPSFRDIATYRNREVRFLKRAQICVADIHSSFAGQAWGNFHDLNQLTIFADYKLPQVLRHLEILEYHPTLAERIDNQQLLQPGEEAEIEIRATTLWACELLRRNLASRNCFVTATQIDERLWHRGQQAAQMRPYHRTRTIYY